MQHLFQSSFLQALGYAIANSLWQTALVWLIYMSASRLLSMSAAAKYRLAVASQVTGFVWFVFTFQFYYQQYNTAWQSTANFEVVPQVQQEAVNNTGIFSQFIHWIANAELLLPYISMAYLLLMMVLCVRWMMGYQKTQLIRSNGLQKMPAEWRLFVKKIALQLSIKKEVRIFLSSTITSPLTIGFWKPVILIPVASINHLSTDQLEAVLLHELAHIKRYDYVVNILLSIVEISLFFNPFTQLLSKSIHKERENSCDDWVLQFKYDATVYAQALLRIASLQTIPAFAMAATGKKNELLIRVKRMIEQKENRFSYRRQLLAFLIMTGILSSIAWLTPMKPHTANAQTTNVLSKPSLFKKKQTATLPAEPILVTADNPLFNPVFFLSKPLKEEMRKSIAAAKKEIESAVSEDATGATYTDMLSSLQPIVSNAMEIASQANLPELPDLNKELAAMEIAKTAMRKTVASADSTMAGFAFKNKFKEDITAAIKKMDVDMMRAKKDIERSRKEMKGYQQEKEKAKKELEQALNSLSDLKQLGLDKLILNSLLISEKALNAAFETKTTVIQKKAESDVLPLPDENELPLKQKIDEALEKIEEPSEDITYLPAYTPLLISFNENKRVTIDAVTLIKLKTLLLKRSRELGVRFVPVVKKNKAGVGEEKIVIQF